MNQILSNKIRVEAEICRRSFYVFLKNAYRQLGDIPYVDNWHIDLMCRALQYLYNDKIPSNNLLINIPPSHMKSLTVSVIFPLWVWINNPTKKFLFISYAESRSLEDAKRRRMIFNSEWFQNHFKIPLSQTGDNLQRLTNVLGGSFFSTGVGGQVTGEHVDYIVCDDLQNADDRYSEAATKKMIDFYSNTLPSRFNDPKSGKKIVICQRLSDKDIVAHIEDTKEPFEKIILPELNDGIRYRSHFSDLNDPRDEGELLWAEKFGLPEIMKLQYSMSKQDIASQYQQRAAPISGNIFKKEWFKNRIENTDIVWRFLFVDSASSLKGDYTSILCAEVMSDYRVFVRNIFRERLEFPELIKAIKQQAQDWHYKLHSIVIENKSSGIEAIQVLRKSADRELAEKINEYNPKKTKEERASIQAVWCEKGRIVLPPPSISYPWLLPFEDELFNFPNGKNDDMTDTFVMMIEYLGEIIADGYLATEPKMELAEDLYGYRY